MRFYGGALTLALDLLGRCVAVRVSRALDVDEPRFCTRRGVASRQSDLVGIPLRLLHDATGAVVGIHVVGPARPCSVGWSQP